MLFKAKVNGRNFSRKLTIQTISFQLIMYDIDLSLPVVLEMDFILTLSNGRL